MTTKKVEKDGDYYFRVQCVSWGGCKAEKRSRISKKEYDRINKTLKKSKK